MKVLVTFTNSGGTTPGVFPVEEVLRRGKKRQNSCNCGCLFPGVDRAVY